MPPPPFLTAPYKDITAFRNAGFQEEELRSKQEQPFQSAIGRAADERATDPQAENQKPLLPEFLLHPALWPLRRRPAGRKG